MFLPCNLSPSCLFVTREELLGTAEQWWKHSTTSIPVKTWRALRQSVSHQLFVLVGFFVCRQPGIPESVSSVSSTRSPCKLSQIPACFSAWNSTFTLWCFLFSLAAVVMSWDSSGRSVHFGLPSWSWCWREVWLHRRKTRGSTCLSFLTGTVSCCRPHRVHVFTKCGSSSGFNDAFSVYLQTKDHWSRLEQMLHQEKMFTRLAHTFVRHSDGFPSVVPQQSSVLPKSRPRRNSMCDSVSKMGGVVCEERLPVSKV